MLSLKQLLKKAKKKLSRLDNERLAIALVSLVGLGLLLPLLIFAPELLESEWFLNLLNISAEYGSFIAGGAYIGRLVNLFTARSFTTNKKEQKTEVTTLLNKKVVMGRQILDLEKELTPVGMLLGVILAVICILLHITVPFFSIFSYFAYILFILGYACALGGLFNRLGSSIDGTRLSQEKKAILFGVIFGFIFALSLIIVLALTGTLPLVAVAGISKVFFDLFVLHKTLFTFIFVFSITSLSTSFFDYFAKAICFLKYKYHVGVADYTINARIGSRYHEYRGACLGLPIGCVLAIGIVTSLILTCGLIAAPFAVVATIIITFITCSSVVSALFSRIGRVIDGIQRASTLSEEKTDDSQARLTSEQNGNLSNGIGHSARKSYADDLREINFHNPSIIKPQVRIFNANVLVEKPEQNGQVIRVNKADNVLSPQEETYSHRVMLIHLEKKPADIFRDEPNNSLNLRKYRQKSAFFFQNEVIEKKSNESSSPKFTLA